MLFTLFEQTLIPFCWTSLFPDRIDANVEDTQLNVDLAHTEILKYFQSVSSNRWLLIKIFLILIIFFIVFVVFMTWSSLLRGADLKNRVILSVWGMKGAFSVPFFLFELSFSYRFLQNEWNWIFVRLEHLSVCSRFKTVCPFKFQSMFLYLSSQLLKLCPIFWFSDYRHILE